jgi:hypothetical protein
VQDQSEVQSKVSTGYGIREVPPTLSLKFGTEKHGTAALAALWEASASLLPLSKPPFFVY